MGGGEDITTCPYKSHTMMRYYTTSRAITQIDRQTDRYAYRQTCKISGYHYVARHNRQKKGGSVQGISSIFSIFFLFLKKILFFLLCMIVVIVDLKMGMDSIKPLNQSHGALNIFFGLFSPNTSHSFFDTAGKQDKIR